MYKILLLSFICTVILGKKIEYEFGIELKDSSLSCKSCEKLIKDLISKRKTGMDVDELSDEFLKLCKLLDIGSNKCKGTVLKNVETFAYSVDNNPNLDGQRFCSLTLQSDKNCDIGDNFNWTIDIPDGQTVERKNIRSGGSFKILHLSDVHYEPDYRPNKTNSCEDLCCLVDQPDGNIEDGTACGYWGEYENTDMPMHTIEEIIRHANTQEFDFVYFTGDFVNHRTWDTSRENNTANIKELFSKFREAFRVPFYSIIGNHEPSPADSYSTANETDDSISTQWLYNLMAEEMSTWLPEGAIFNGGFYTVSPKKGFKIVVLNNNVAHIDNWWLLNDDYDPYGQLNWLVKVLKEAEDNYESVHILAHMPPGNKKMLTVWGREYNRIVERFSNTITAQFNGHTHKDEFVIYYNSSEPTQAINVAINGASVISDESNPNYKIHEIDDTTFEVIDSDVWTFNLTQANLNPEMTPEWYKLYSFREAYEVDSLEPKELDDLANRMAANHSLIEQFYKFQYRNADQRMAKGCGKSCQKKRLCSLVTTIYSEKDNTQCKALKKIYKKNK